MRIITAVHVVFQVIAAAARVPAALASEPATAADARVIETCLAAAGQSEGKREACVGRVSQPCLDKAGSTAGMIACADREYRVWDARLNSDYGKLMGLLPDPAKASRRDIERGFVALQDKKCRFDFLANQGGTMWSVTGAQCAVSETAREVLWIDSKIKMLSPR